MPAGMEKPPLSEKEIGFVGRWRIHPQMQATRRPMPNQLPVLRVRHDDSFGYGGAVPCGLAFKLRLL
jgi:hypothetical protein